MAGRENDSETDKGWGKGDAAVETSGGFSPFLSKHGHLEATRDVG